jgi:hypothetical protein
VSGVLLRRQTGAALVTFLNGNTPFVWGDSEQPDNATVPYGVVYCMNTEPEWPDVANELEQVGCHYFQLTCVGVSREQVAFVSAQACKALTDRNAAGYLLPMAVAGGTVTNRLLNNMGSINRQSEKLYSSADSYKIHVEG